MREEIIKEIQELKKKLNELRDIIKFDTKLKKVEELKKTAARPDFWNKVVEAKNTMMELKSSLDDIKEFNQAQKKISDLESIYELVDDEALKKEVIKDLKDAKKLLKRIELKTLLGEEDDKKNAIFSIHAGAGGTEAQDWVSMLLRMYSRWLEKKGYTATITEITPGEQAGIKRVVLIVEGSYAYGMLKAESGVHRLVRISPFDANKRRHTSFAAVNVIPLIEEEKIKINESDLKIETFRASGHGGQHVNKTESAVRITHIPTGIVVSCQNERSQHKNKATALKILESKLNQLERLKRQKELEKLYDEKGDISWGYQIRSYILMPYKLVKDLRTDYQTQDVDAMLDGELLDDFIYSYLKYIKSNVKAG